MALKHDVATTWLYIMLLHGGNYMYVFVLDQISVLQINSQYLQWTRYYANRQNFWGWEVDNWGLGGKIPGPPPPPPRLYETLRCDNNIIIIYRSVVSSLSTRPISFSVGRIMPLARLTVIAIVKRPESTLPCYCWTRPTITFERFMRCLNNS